MVNLGKNSIDEATHNCYWSQQSWKPNLIEPGHEKKI